MLDHDVAVVLEAVPELAAWLAELAVAQDGDPGAAVVFAELADYVAELAADPVRNGPQLARCLGAIEVVAATSPDADELVGWSFLDGIGNAELETLRPWFGPRTMALVEEVRGP